MVTEFLLLGIVFMATEFHGRRNDFFPQGCYMMDGIGI